MFKEHTILLDESGNELLTVKYGPSRNPHWVGEQVNGTTVASLQLLSYEDTEATLSSRRKERDEEFKETIDRMNPAWYNSLTAAQKTSLETWRQDWLDYPSTGSLPTRVEIFN
jgi:hypothetical protein